jgi:hypothetical protein
MKPIVSSLAIGLLAFFISGCQGAPQARVFRVGMQDGAGRWLVSVNDTKPRLVASSQDLCMYLTSLRLHHGDLMVFKGQASVVSGQLGECWSLLTSYCSSNRVAMYLYGGQNPSSELFSVPIYNWTAPFDNPRKFSAAAFFDGGRFLGVGTNGFEKMVRSIAKRKVAKVLVLGSLYNMDSQFGPFERPYEVQQGLLDQVLKENRTELVLLDPL